MSNKFDVIFFVSGSQNDPSSRTRGYAFAKELSNLGLTVFFHWSHSMDLESGLLKSSLKHMINYMKDFVNRFAVFLSSKSSDIFYVQRSYQCGFPYLLGKLSSFFQVFMIFFVKVIVKRKVVFDFDDALYLEKSLVTYMFTRTSDCVIAGGHALQVYSSCYNRRVFLIPTALPVKNIAMVKKTDEYTKEFSKEMITFGWLGSPSTIKYLELLVEPLNVLGLEHNIEFRVIGSRNKVEYNAHKNLFSKFKNVKLVLVLWSKETELTELSKFDVGLAPLASGGWEEGKCGFKLLMYLARGIPCVASGVGENTFIIENGKNGFLCYNTGDFVEKLRLLIPDECLRRTFKVNGRSTVEDRYDLELNARKLLTIIQKVAST